MAKPKKDKEHKIVSEFRKDLVSGEWILVSSLRQFRPHYFAPPSHETSARQGKAERDKTAVLNCPFEDPQASGNPAPVLWYPKPGKATEDFKKWFVQIIPNKYPVLSRNHVCAKRYDAGPYEKIEAYGFHEVIITRDHFKPLHKMSVEEISVVLKAYRDRHKALTADDCVEYVLIFHNHGERAGASVAHPHSQLVALPIVPPDVASSINGGVEYFEKNQKCVHCVMLDFEMKEKIRIVSKNEHFVTLAPFASRVPYETRIFPLKHESDFADITDEELPCLAEILKDTLMRISKTLKEPDYNFFIHTASSKSKNVPYYHWHIEILPRSYKWAGLELGTGIEVVSVAPEQAAEELRNSIK